MIGTDDNIVRTDPDNVSIGDYRLKVRPGMPWTCLPYRALCANRRSNACTLRRLCKFSCSACRVSLPGCRLFLSGCGLSLSVCGASLSVGGCFLLVGGFSVPVAA